MGCIVQPLPERPGSYASNNMQKAQAHNFLNTKTSIHMHVHVRLQITIKSTTAQHSNLPPSESRHPCHSATKAETPTVRIVCTSQHIHAHAIAITGPTTLDTAKTKPDKRHAKSLQANI